MFAYELALELGWPDVEALLDSMTSAQMTRWLAFDSVSPIGRKRFDVLAAAMMATTVNSNPWRGKKPAARLADFVIRWRPKAPDASRVKQVWSQVKDAWRRKQNG